MIKSEIGVVEIKGTVSEIRADLYCVLKSLKEDMGEEDANKLWLDVTKERKLPPELMAIVEDMADRLNKELMGIRVAKVIKDMPEEEQERLKELLEKNRRDNGGK